MIQTCQSDVGADVLLRSMVTMARVSQIAVLLRNNTRTATVTVRSNALSLTIGVRASESCDSRPRPHGLSEPA